MQMYVILSLLPPRFKSC